GHQRGDASSHAEAKAADGVPFHEALRLEITDATTGVRHELIVLQCCRQSERRLHLGVRFHALRQTEKVVRCKSGVSCLREAAAHVLNVAVDAKNFEMNQDSGR